MTIGLSILLAAVGAILRYAVADQVDDVDLAMIGLILMIAGAVGLVAGLIQTAGRRRVVTEVREAPVREVRRVD
jgi:hypothetical protein